MTTSADDDSAAVLISAPSAAAALALERALAALPGETSGEAAGPLLKPDAERTGGVFRLSAAGRSLEIPAPARLGYVLDRARALTLPASGQRVLKAGAYTLDLMEKRWEKPGIDGAGAAAGVDADADNISKNTGTNISISISLTDREAALLEALILAPGHSLERSALLEKVWGYHKDAETHTLETHIYRLRRKIEDDAGAPKILLTEGASYRLVF